MLNAEIKGNATFASLRTRVPKPALKRPFYSQVYGIFTDSPYASFTCGDIKAEMCRRHGVDYCDATINGALVALQNRGYIISTEFCGKRLYCLAEDPDPAYY